MHEAQAVRSLITPEGLQRFRDFVESAGGESYPEVPMEPHRSVSRMTLAAVLEQCKIPPTGRILDVGCGQGPALDLLQEKGYAGVGVTVNDIDVEECRKKGHEVYKMDMSFLDFPERSFDLIWARHCVEHSIAPYFTLSGFARLLKPGGFLYVEVPSPDTPARHESNINHYSVLGKTMWRHLLHRCGILPEWEHEFEFTVPCGVDKYFMFLGRKDSL